MNILSRRRMLAATGLAAGFPVLLRSRSAQARVGPDSFAPLAKRVLPAVVNIAVTETVTSQDDPFAALPPELRKQFRDRFRSRRREMEGAGSGFIIDPSGVIVTNNHVVGNADKIVVGFFDGSELPARLIGTDDLTDVAVIRVEPPKPLPSVTWGDSRAIEVGDWVLAAGNPFGLGGSVTVGIVSARGRDIGASPFDDFIQIDAPINPGNSGGPLFSEEGEVVGVNSAIASPTGASVGIGFAVPSEIAARIVAELREKGRVDRGWLGVSVQEVPNTEGRGNIGIGIANVDRSGPAARAGIKPGDVVTAVNGRPVDSARGLIKAIAAIPPGDSARVRLQRQGRPMEVAVVVGRRPPSD
jgi:serine protease Do